MKSIKDLNGMKAFTVVWAGQFVSITGSAMTRFALMIWAYEKTQMATVTALLGFFSIILYILLSPAAGFVVDRFSRKIIMILSVFASASVALTLLILYSTGNLMIWHMFLAEALLGAVEAFQSPAYLSAITMIVPKEQYARTSGMRSLSSNFSSIFAPIFAGILLSFFGIRGVMLVDLGTFFVAMGTLLAVHIPNPEFVKSDSSSVFKNFKFSFKYIFERKGLFYLMIIFLLMNLFSAITYFGILPAMILSRSGNNKMVLSAVQSALGIGGVVGGIMISAFGYPREKIKTILLTGCGSFLLGDIFLGAGSSVYSWCAAAFMSSIFIPFIGGGESSIWQSKVEPSIQGRIFSTKGMLQQSCMPVGYLLGGILADNVFEPLMAHNVIMQNIFVPIVGAGKGSGMAVMFLFTGTFGTISCLLGFAVKSLRNLEKDLPDFDD